MTKVNFKSKDNKISEKYIMKVSLFRKLLLCQNKNSVNSERLKFIYVKSE
jgi:hypothetical protein